MPRARRWVAKGAGPTGFPPRVWCRGALARGPEIRGVAGIRSLLPAFGGGVRPARLARMTAGDR